MDQLLKDPFFYELLKDIQELCSISSLEELAKQVIKAKKTTNPTRLSCFMCSVSTAYWACVFESNVQLS